MARWTGILVEQIIGQCFTAHPLQRFGGSGAGICGSGNKNRAFSSKVHINDKIILILSFYIIWMDKETDNKRIDRDPPLSREEELFTPSHMDALHSVAIQQQKYVDNVLIDGYGASPEKLSTAFEQDRDCHFIKANGKPLNKHGGKDHDLDEIISHKTLLTYPAVGSASIRDKSTKDRVSTMISSTKKMFELGGEAFAKEGYQVVGAVYEPANATVLTARRRAYNEDPGNFCCDDARRDAEALFALVADKNTLSTEEVRLNPEVFGEKVSEAYKEEWITSGTPLPMDEVMDNLRLNMSAYSYGGVHLMQSLNHLSNFMEDIGFTKEEVQQAFDQIHVTMINTPIIIDEDNPMPKVNMVLSKEDLLLKPEMDPDYHVREQQAYLQFAEREGVDTFAVNDRTVVSIVELGIDRDDFEEFSRYTKTAHDIRSIVKSGCPDHVKEAVDSGLHTEGTLPDILQLSGLDSLPKINVADELAQLPDSEMPKKPESFVEALRVRAGSSGQGIEI